MCITGNNEVLHSLLIITHTEHYTTTIDHWHFEYYTHIFLSQLVYTNSNCLRLKKEMEKIAKNWE